MQRITALLTSALLVAGMFSTSAVAQDNTASKAAQDNTSPKAAQAQVAAPDTDFSDQTLQQFAEASKEISSVSRDYAKRLQSAQDEADKQKIRMEANENMVSIIEESGLEVSKYNAVGQAIQQDPELMKRVRNMVESQAT